MQSTMQDSPLLISQILRRGQRVFAGSEVVTYTDGDPRRATFGEVAGNAGRLANALDRLGIGAGDRVATLMWNNQEHLEAYLAVPSMGAVLHTLNLRLPSAQLAFILNHAEDRVVIVDSSLLPLLTAIAPLLATVKHVIVVGGGDGSGLPGPQAYAGLIAGESPEFDWPELDERHAASMCYTTGTTGDPKGVVYSHRSIVLHSMAVWGAFVLSDQDRVLPIVPMFHVNAWGTPFAAYMVGAAMIMPDRFLQPQPLATMMERERVTFAAGVPTIFQGLLQYCDANVVDLSTVRRVICGGSAVPPALMEQFEQRHGLRIVQAWGMTETSPIGAVAEPPSASRPEDEMTWRSMTGRVVPGIELRIVDDSGVELAWDGDSVGEIQARGPWVTGSYYRDEAAERFDHGWLRTGDVGTIDRSGFVQITDRTKDVIKSGGEWISSVELETLLAGHAKVADAAVVGVPHERWQERPLAVVTAMPGQTVTPEELREYLAPLVARWWLPERWSIMSDIPKTSVGKQDKRMIRRLAAEGKLDIIDLGRPERSGDSWQPQSRPISNPAASSRLLHDRIARWVSVRLMPGSTAICSVTSVASASRSATSTMAMKSDEPVVV